MADPKLRKAVENWDGQKTTIRPSSVDSYYQCPRQWAMTFLGGIPSIPGARAAMGTAVHAAVEQEWLESMVTKKKDFNNTAMHDLAEATFMELDNEGLQYDEAENTNTAIGAIVKGIDAFVDDIVPFTDIPVAVEKRLSVPINHPVVTEVGGTLDYIGPKVQGKHAQADIKTSKRKPSPVNYKTQQSVYKFLAEANNVPIGPVLIQGVVFKAKPEGHILELEPDVDQAKYLVNSMLDVLDVFSKQVIAPEVLFRGNPKYYLCSEKYCAHYHSCPFVKGEA